MLGRGSSVTLGDEEEKQQHCSSSGAWGVCDVGKQSKLPGSSGVPKPLALCTGTQTLQWPHVKR